MTIEKMKQWLEALEVVNSCIDDYYLPKEKAWLPEIEQAIASLRQAISEAEGQEKALQALHAENERLGLYKDAYAEPVIDKSAAIRIATALGWEPKREWVGLTDEEIDEWTPEIHVVIKAIEAEIKQKNGY